MSSFAKSVKNEITKVRDASRTSETYLRLLEQQGFVVADLRKHREILNQISVAQKSAEKCLINLTSEHGRQRIQNVEELIEKIFKFQEQLRSASDIFLATSVTEQKETDNLSDIIKKKPAQQQAQ